MARVHSPGSRRRARFFRARRRNIIEASSLGESHYNGLWISANERPVRGLQFNASYTLSKSTDYNSLSNNVVISAGQLQPRRSRRTLRL